MERTKKKNLQEVYKIKTGLDAVVNGHYTEEYARLLEQVVIGYHERRKKNRKHVI